MCFHFAQVCLLLQKREYPDGTVKILYEDGRMETRYASGRVRIKDTEGKLVHDSNSNHHKVAKSSNAEIKV